MVNRAWLPTVAAAGLVFVATFTAGCGSSNPKPQVPAPPPAGHAPVRPVPPPPPPPDPITVLIDASQQQFLAGERELKLGHLDRARVEFDRAVEMLLESPYGARTDARLREHFDRLVDRINAYEVTALAQGDGFAEKTIRAGIDRRAPEDCDVSQARARGRRRKRRSRRTLPRPSTTCRSRRTTACWRTSSCSRAGCATTSTRA